jgi:hypothetical protein
MPARLAIRCRRRQTAASVAAVLHAWVLAEREGAGVSEERATFS